MTYDVQKHYYKDLYGDQKIAQISYLVCVDADLWNMQKFPADILSFTVQDFQVRNKSKIPLSMSLSMQGMSFTVHCRNQKIWGYKEEMLHISTALELLNTPVEVLLITTKRACRILRCCKPS